MSAKAFHLIGIRCLVLLGITLFFSSCHAVVGQRQASTEYKVERLEGPTELGIEQALNRWAKEGWLFEEVVMIDSPTARTRDFVIFLRREAR
jgi:hypothetical protein